MYDSRAQPCAGRNFPSSSVNYFVINPFFYAPVSTRTFSGSWAPFPPKAGMVPFEPLPSRSGHAVGTLNSEHPRRLGRVQELSIVNVPGAWVGYNRTRKCGETRPARSAKYPPATALHTVIGRKWEKVGESGSLHRMALSDQILHQWAVTRCYA